MAGRPTSRRLATLVALSLGALVVLILVLWPKAPLPTDRKVNLLYPKIVASLPHFVAQRQKIYAKHHLDVRANPIQSSPDMIDAVRLGKVDFLPAVSLVDAINASLDQDVPPLTIISHSRMKKDVPFDSLLATAGSQLQSLKELEGRTIGVFPGGTSEASIKWFLSKFGINVKKIRFMAVPPREQIDMLLAGKIDAVHAYEPERTLGILQYKCRPLSPSVYAAISEPASIGCTALASRVLREDPERARAIIAAWDEAIDFIRQHENEARDILADELGYSRDVAHACTWVDATKSSEVDIVALQKFIGILQGMEPPQVRPGQPARAVFYGDR